MIRKTYVEIDEATLCENVRKIRAAYPSYEYCFGVVKGDAYGHGMRAVRALVAGGVNYLAVATVEEAIKVRRFDETTPILCLEPVDPAFLTEVIRYGITVTVDSLERFREWNKTPLPAPVKIHVKLDTGMNRLGIKDAAQVKALFSEKRQENLVIEGIYTHLATSGVNDPYYDRQMKKFEELTREIDLSAVPIVHVGRSLILVHHEKPAFVNGVRLGICMYGFAQSLNPPTGVRKLKRDLLLKRLKISPSILQNDLDLKTAFRLYSEIISVKRVEKGEFVGYGASFTAPEAMNVATVAIGYYDGMDAALGRVSVGGKDCPILGELCMDMTLIRVPDGVKCGDRAEIFGERISVREAARRSGKSAYRVLTGISARVPRIYGDEEFYL